VKQIIIYISVVLVTISCQRRNESAELSEVQLPIEFLSIKTPLLFHIDNKHAFKLGCEPIHRNRYWTQGYYHGDDDTTFCVSVEKSEINYQNFINSSKVEEHFLSCMELSGGTATAGTHLYTREYETTSTYLMVSTVSKYDSSSNITNKTYFRKSVSIRSANHKISVNFRIRFNGQVPFESVVKNFADYRVLYNP